MRARRANEPLGAATARARFDPPRTVNAPLFGSLIERLAEDRRWVVLDLGPARPQTVALFGRYRCRLDIADIAGSIGKPTSTEEPESLAERMAGLLPPPHSEPTDIVLSWDSFNYLERDALTSLSSVIAARCRPGSLLHALVVYSESRMPARPGQYAPVDDCRLERLSTNSLTRVAPRYSPEDLRLCMPDFHVEQAYLLKNGVQEYLFRLGPAAS